MKATITTKLYDNGIAIVCTDDDGNEAKLVSLERNKIESIGAVNGTDSEAFKTKGIDIFDRQDTAARAQAINDALDDPEDEPDEQETTADPPRDSDTEPPTGEDLADEMERRMGFKPFGSEL